MIFVGDAIKEYLNKVCEELCIKNNIGPNEASRYIIDTGFYIFLKENLYLMKENKAAYWADKIYEKVCLQEVF